MPFTIICNYFKRLYCDRRDQLPLTELCRGRSQTFGIFCTSTCSTSSVVPQSQLLERRHFYAAIQLHNDYRKTPRLSERHRFFGGPQTTAVEHYFKIPALLSQPTAITPALCLVQSPLEVKHNIKPGHSAHTQIQLYDITDKNGDSKDMT